MAIDKDVNIVDIIDTDDNREKVDKGNEIVGKGEGEGLDKSIHAVGGGEDMKRKGKAKREEEDLDRDI